jgi:NAD(P)-dependent dehydrogenase (short-subunit alcohol dehydrogenase family)
MATMDVLYDLTGRVAVVTGGGTGIGAATARLLADHGADVAIAARTVEDLERTSAAVQDATGRRCLPVPTDVKVEEQVVELVRRTVEELGRIDILINNAGIIEVGPIESQTTEAFERAMQLNFFAALHTTWAALPHMRSQSPLPKTKRRASIVNIASIGGKLAVPHMLPYSASKFALVGFSEGLHAELRHKGICVTTVCPGLMRTGGEAHAQFVGDIEFERRWFDFAANAPLISVTAKHAANKIYAAVTHGRAEITISPQAWLAARAAGLAPETTQLANALVDRYILPEAP